MDRLRRAQSCPWQFAAFHRAHMELTAPDPPITLDDPAWPFLTSDVSVGPARVAATARVAESLLGPGVDVAGTVEGSVLGRHVTVEEGAGGAAQRRARRGGGAGRAEVVDAIVDVGVVIDPGTVGERYESDVAVYAPGAPVRP
jgi:glucose-1-phosphate adenylyltransferase